MQILKLSFVEFKYYMCNNNETYSVGVCQDCEGYEDCSMLIGPDEQKTGSSSSRFLRIQIWIQHITFSFKLVN